MIADQDDDPAAGPLRFLLQLLEVADDFQRIRRRSVMSPIWTRMVLPPPQ